ncbi:MAG: hypothetical protein P1T08_13415 [Acidimicrobiia bacterium]|nr:hypothetical protein [Acidimicrobiia bacterium]
MSTRRSLAGFGGPFRPPSVVSVALAALLALGACTDAAGTTTTTTPVPTSSTSTTTTADPPATSTSTSAATTSTTELPTDTGVEAAWSSYWEAWTEVRASEDLDPAPLEAVASAQVVEGATVLFERQRESGQGPIETDVSLHPTVTAEQGNSATIEDCVLLAPSFTDNVGVWYEADLVRSDQGWKVDAVRIRSASGCVPREMADAAIQGYQAYYEAEADFWDPPNPSSPLLEQVLTEPQLSFITGLLDEHAALGAALRGQPTTHPEVIEVRSSTEVVILSSLCVNVS